LRGGASNYSLREISVRCYRDLVPNEVGLSYRNKAMKVNLWDTMSGINLCLIRGWGRGRGRRGRKIPYKNECLCRVKFCSDKLLDLIHSLLYTYSHTCKLQEATGRSVLFSCN